MVIARKKRTMLLCNLKKPNNNTQMKYNGLRHLAAIFLFSLICIFPATAQPALIHGKVFSTEGEAIDYATVFLKGTGHSSYTDRHGGYRLDVPTGEYTLAVSAIGFETYEKRVTISSGETIKHDIRLKPSITRLEGSVVTGNSIGRVKRSAFNAVAVETKGLQNSAKNLGDALTRLPGMKLRETGGVGSDMQLMLDGFSGKHVKVFIDGVPQEGASTAFDLNNMPVNFAERIEVYKGVVPVSFGTDAIGGVINIVTNKARPEWYVDASYSFGSFNTHKSYVNFGQTLKNGFTYEINAFQNYSDNNYYIDNWVREFEVDENGDVHKFPVDKDDVKHVRRFHDTFHNEVVMAKLGVAGKNWADRLIFGISYSNFYKDIQTGVYQEIVFGQKHRKGWSVSPSLEYVKRDLIVKGLDITIAANFNYNITNNIDTSARYYNWYGEYYVKDTRGEQSYQNSESKNTNLNASININYRIGKTHTFTFNHVTSDFRRKSRSYIGTSSVLTAFDIPKVTRKNISGLSYRLAPSRKWNVSVFGKYYNQYNQGPVSQSADGVGDYISMERTTDSFGYGIAGTYIPIKDFQIKLSYEKAYRLPTTDELFGDEDLEAGKTDLKPEKSDNFNLNLSYGHDFGEHRIYAEGSLIYRDTKDYIKRGLGKHGSTQFGIYENHGHVKTMGYNISLRYSYSKWFDAGITYNDIDTRDYEKTWTGGSLQESMHYKVRLPNIPYRYAGFDANFYWHDLFAEGNTLSVTYDNFWQHEFPLYWENIGNKDSKNYVPSQFSHNLSITYSIKDGRYNISFECRNLTDEKLYDNFSLQKAGRAFYLKVRVHFGSN